MKDEHQQPKECDRTYCWTHKEGYCYAKCSLPHPAPAPSCQTRVDEMAIFCRGCPNLIAHLDKELKKSVDAAAREHDAVIIRKAREDMGKLLKAVFEKYRHLEQILMDPTFDEEGDIRRKFHRECWNAIKESLRSTQQQAGERDE